MENKKKNEQFNYIKSVLIAIFIISSIILSAQCHLV